jgi:DNA-binding LacI/PurR family transcriptional regulator
MSDPTIANGASPMKQTRPTIYDVAAAAGVSKSLVSLVLRGSDRVSEASRAAVEKAIAELDYQPNKAASDLAAARTGHVGVLIDDYANPWFVDLLRGLGEVLGAAGYRLSVVDSLTLPRAEDPVAALLSMRVDGIVVARDVPEVLLGRTAPPLVVAGTRANSPGGIDAVANDDTLGARLATEHLLGLGHRTIAHLAVAGGAGEAREASFLDTMRRAGARGVVLPRRDQASEHAGFEDALAVLRARPDVTAVFAANDVMAIGALGAALELGLDVPGRLSVVGYDNTELARTRLIDLTTVDDVSHDVGVQTARLLLARMSGEDPVDVRRTLEPALVVRGTTAAPGGR